MAELGVGVVGCGVISGIYMENMPKFAGLKLVACTDIIPERSAAKAKEHGIADVTPEDIYKRDDVDLILNITPPLVHYEVSRAALMAGKHVFSEKPLSVEPEHASALAAEAAKRGLKLGCAPDTFLGAGARLAREIIDLGKIGKVVAGTWNLMSRGLEHWHPDPRAFYIHGGGPVYDMAPYYLNALINLLGPVESVQSRASTAFATRRVTSDSPLRGQDIPVETPTTVMGLLHFASGADVSVFMSWDIWKHGHPGIELYGTEGVLRVPDPNFYGGAVEYSVRGGDWISARPDDRAFGRPNWRSPFWPPERVSQANYRCLGLAEIASAILHDTAHRASMALGDHVVEVMHALVHRGAEGVSRLKSTASRPAALSEADAAKLWAGGWR